MPGSATMSSMTTTPAPQEGPSPDRAATVHPAVDTAIDDAVIDDAGAATVVVLAGGTSRRFGGDGDDKLDATLAGRTVLGVTVANLPSWPTIVVGPSRDGVTERAVRWVREDPPLGGPAAALTAALPHVTTPWCAVLAGDMPFGGRLLEPLLHVARGGSRTFASPNAPRATPSDAPGMPEDAGASVPEGRFDGAPEGPFDGARATVDGRAQPLLAMYRTASLRRAARLASSPRDLSMRALLRPLSVVDVPVERLGTIEDARDIDTLADLEAHLTR